MSHDFDCPYCGEPFEVCHDDGHGYAEGVKHHDRCRSCDKAFVFETSICFYFEPERADCLNDGQHSWKATRSYPVESTRMQCAHCGDERKPTPEEMAAIAQQGKGE
jgi:hypothetical protein